MGKGVRQDCVLSPEWQATVWTTREAQVILFHHFQTYAAPILSRRLKLLSKMICKNLLTKHKIQIKQDLNVPIVRL